jgi:hypothetical protein
MYVLNSLLKVHCLYFKISNGIDTAFGYDLQCEGFEWYNKAGKTERFEKRVTYRNMHPKYPSGFYYWGFIKTNYSDHIISKYYKQQDLNLHRRAGDNMCYKNILAKLEGSNQGSQDSYMLWTEAYDNLKQAAQNAGIPISDKRWDNEYLDQITFLNLYSLQNNEIYFKIFLNNYLSTEEIQKVTEYKVEPVVKKNWFD